MNDLYNLTKYKKYFTQKTKIMIYLLLVEQIKFLIEKMVGVFKYCIFCINIINSIAIKKFIKSNNLELNNYIVNLLRFLYNLFGIKCL